MKKIFLFLTSLGAASGCANTDRPDTGGPAIATSSDKSALFVADTDEGTVLRVDVSSRTVQATPVGKEPTRVARSGSRVFVTLRGERAVAVLRDTGGALELETKLSVGAEPYGAVTSSDGKKVWIASSLSNRVDELDAVSLELLRSFEVSGEPRWLTIDAGERALFVGVVREPVIVRIDLETEAITKTDLPMSNELRGRVTGDLAVTPNGERLIAPVLYVRDDLQAGSTGWGSGRGFGLDIPGQINPTAVVAEVGDDGELTGEMDVQVMGAWIGTFGTGRAFELGINGYIASVTPSPDSSYAVFSVEGSGEIALMPLIAPTPVPSRFSARAGVVLPAGAGARAAAFSGNNTLWAFGFIDRTVTELELGDVPEQMRQFDIPFDLGDRVKTTTIQLAPSTLPKEIERGRRFFYASNDGYMQAAGGRLSCATCHFEGRDDGFTWTVPELGPRQTPSLAGPVSMTAPVRWEGDRATVAIDALETSVGLMGGALLEADALAIEAFVDWTRDADVEKKSVAGEQTERGRAIFERPDVGCATCHNGPRMTNNQLYAMFGLDRVKTRSLIGLAATAPYLHDGSAPTLRALLEMSNDGGMGNVRGLSEAERADLIAYLESL